MLIKTVSDFRRAMRYGKYAWPGAYPCFFITSDGCALSFEAARAERRNIVESIAHGLKDGWQIVAMDINYENPDLYCDHTGNRIETAYCEEDSETGRDS